MVALAAGIPWAFALIPLVDSGNATWYAVAVAGTYAVAGSSYGPMGAFILELFATRYRYSGAGLAHNLADLIGGALPPLIAAPLMATWGAVAIGAMLATYSVISLVTTYLLPETMSAPMGASA
jgi:hypothetical protein